MSSVQIGKGITQVYRDNSGDAEFMAAIADFNTATRFTEWGKELPPVGTVCEISYTFHQGSDMIEAGEVVEIIAHIAANCDLDKPNEAVFLVTRDGSRFVKQAVAGCFRKIKTIEEIRAEEKEKHLSNLLANYGSNVYDSNSRAEQMSLLSNLYDAGFIDDNY